MVEKRGYMGITVIQILLNIVLLSEKKPKHLSSMEILDVYLFPL